VLLIVLAGVFWSFGGVLSKYTAWNALTLSGIRSLIGMILLGIMRKSFRIVHQKATWIGAFGVVMTSVLFMMANKLTSAANAIVLQYAMPIFVVVYQAVVKGQKSTFREGLTILVVLLGVVLCFCQGFTGGSLLGNVLALCSALSWAIVFIAAREPGCDAMNYSFQGNLLGCLLLINAPFDEKVGFSSPIPWLVAAALGICLGMGYLCFSLGMRSGVSSVTAAIVANIEPILNPTWCFLMLGEYPGHLSMAGALIVLLAVTAYSISSGRKYQSAVSQTECLHEVK
jgi:drug/metabolite transporter (DMT)-like permease